VDVNRDNKYRRIVKNSEECALPYASGRKTLILLLQEAMGSLSIMHFSDRVSDTLKTTL
jgi:hypothetical protein